MDPLYLFKQLYDSIIKQIEAVENLSIEYDMLDSQEYLNYKDKLNKLSLDPDRD